MAKRNGNQDKERARKHYEKEAEKLRKQQEEEGGNNDDKK